MTNSFLLINPEALAYQTHYDIFRVVHQTKINNKPGFNFDSRIIPNTRAIYSGTNTNVTELIRSLDASRIKNEIDKLAKVHAKQKSGISFDVYIDRAAPRMFYELFSGLTSVSSELKLYHRIKNKDTGNYKVAPCILSNSKATLSFSVQKANGKLALVPVIELNGEKSELSTFQVFAFLLEKNGIYTTLSVRDSQTLDWLARANPNQYGSDPVAFTEKIVSILERDYEVKKDEVFKINLIECEPQHAVYLSEISDTFLMLTPRWDYEGFVVETTDEAELEEMRQGEIYRIVRQKEAETAFVEKLRALHPNFEKQRNGQFYLSFDDAKKKHWFLKVYQMLLSENVQVVGMDMLKHFRYSPHSIHTEMAIGRTIDSDLHLNIKVSFGEEKVDLSHIQRTLFNAQKFILLKDNSIGVISDEWYEQYGAMFKHGRIAQGELIVPQWILLSMEDKYRSRELKPVIANEWWADWQKWQTSSDEMIQVPASLKAILRPYQHKGFEWMVLLSRIGAGACLADDMGLGKTLQTIAFLLHSHAENPGARFLILSPLSLVFNWKEELAKFAPHLGIYIYHQNNRSVKDFMTSDARVMISSYGTARSAVDDLSVVQWHTLVIDESHNIKNPTAQITKAVYKLSAANRIALSGTPVMNNTFDIYSQLNFLLPGLLGGAEFFKREYAIPIDRDMSVEKTNALQKVTAPFVLRRTKKQVAADL
ncbi:MAG: box helicase, partial [Bacteroidetes bacterium]|nr:box helicase [Bacteroidota bacterium]